MRDYLETYYTSIGFITMSCYYADKGPSSWDVCPQLRAGTFSLSSSPGVLSSTPGRIRTLGWNDDTIHVDAEPSEARSWLSRWMLCRREPPAASCGSHPTQRHHIVHPGDGTVAGSRVRHVPLDLDENP